MVRMLQECRTRRRLAAQKNAELALDDALACAPRISAGARSAASGCRFDLARIVPAVRRCRFFFFTRYTALKLPRQMISQF